MLVFPAKGWVIRKNGKKMPGKIDKMLDDVRTWNRNCEHRYFPACVIQPE
jgi:hypothetical protein